MPARLTIEEFTEKAIEKHGDEYDYSLVEYHNNVTPIKIVCKRHGVFVQTPLTHLCAHGCSICGRGGNLEERFWAKVDKRTSDKCWNWLGTKTRGGYGMIRNKRMMSAHRLSYIFHKGDIPDGLCVCHSCDNPSCVNPNHLWLGTHSENTQDAYKKGRLYIPRGEENHKSKLTVKDVKYIRSLYATGKFSQRVLGKMYNVKHSTIGNITRGKTWKIH